MAQMQRVEEMPRGQEVPLAANKASIGDVDAVLAAGCIPLIIVFKEMADDGVDHLEWHVLELHDGKNILRAVTAWERLGLRSINKS
jgi:hypothetical protein